MFTNSVQLHNFFTLGECSYWFGDPMLSPTCRPGLFAGGSGFHGWVAPTSRSSRLIEHELRDLDPDVMRFYASFYERYAENVRMCVSFRIAADPMSSLSPSEFLSISIEDHRGTGAPIIINVGTELEYCYAICPLVPCWYACDFVDRWGACTETSPGATADQIFRFIDQWTSGVINVGEMSDARGFAYRWWLVGRAGGKRWNPTVCGMHALFRPHVQKILSWSSASSNVGRLRPAPQRVMTS